MCGDCIERECRLRTAGSVSGLHRYHNIMTMVVFQEVREGRNKVDNLTRKWYKEVRAAPSESEDEGGGGNVLEMEETSLMTPSNHH